MSLIDKINAARVQAAEYAVMADLRSKGLSQQNNVAPHVIVNPTIADLTAKIVEWANMRFPNRTPDKAFLKFFEEMGELVASPTSPGEYADVAIMLFDLADMHGVDMAKAIQDKLLILEGRKQWTQNELGVFQHVEPTTEAVCGRALSDGTLCNKASGSWCEVCI